jgi:hypothetical protein
VKEAARQIDEMMTRHGTEEEAGVVTDCISEWRASVLYCNIITGRLFLIS